MTYFLGSDVDVFLTTEHQYYSVSGGFTSATAVSGALSVNAIGNSDMDPFSVIPNREKGLNAKARVSDVTGIDFTPGTRNEDISYMGKRTGLSAEVKKEYVITLTRKVTDNTFKVLFNTPARNGVYVSGGDVDTTTGTAKIHDGLTTSKNRNFGYRIQLQLAPTGASALGATMGEVITIRNACITAYTQTYDPNNAVEETIEFYSYVQPVLTSGLSVSVTGATAAVDI